MVVTATHNYAHTNMVNIILKGSRMDLTPDGDGLDDSGLDLTDENPAFS